MPRDARMTLPALDELLALIEEGGGHLEARELARVEAGGRSWPVLAVMLGNPDPALPALATVGGVHGLERIGAEVVLAWLKSLVMRLAWDASLHRQLEDMRIVLLPLANPGGIAAGTRANPAGVDLMRNAPVEAAGRVPFLVGGQRRSPRLPWYRGTGDLEPEALALCTLVEEELLPRPFSLAIDCHSGFGAVDRLWFPFAHTHAPIAHLPEVRALHELLAGTYSQHPYTFEPQSRQYLAHGDLWDHLYLASRAAAGGVFLPLTLEMGSWVWVRKNPRQLFTRGGLFNPLIAHRQQRVLRRHLPLLDFFQRAALSAARWLPRGAEREVLRGRALADWYAGRR